MRFVGADLHKKSITFCVVKVVDRKTQVVHRQRMLCKDVAKVECFFETVVPFEVTVEATIGTSIKNTIRGILTRYNGDRRDVFTKLGWQAVQKLELLDEERLRDAARRPGVSDAGGGVSRSGPQRSIPTRRTLLRIPHS